MLLPSASTSALRSRHTLIYSITTTDVLMKLSRAISPFSQRRCFLATTAPMSTPVRFHKFDVSSQVFLEKPRTIGIVNLKPIVPLHVLLIPRHPYRRLAELPQEDLDELFQSVQLVSTKVQKLVGATACTVSIQDGADAGQSVPHLHVHILPRKKGDITPNDLIYQHLEAFGLSLPDDLEKVQSYKYKKLGPDADEDRKSRCSEEMHKEAAWLRQHMAE